MLKHIFNKDDIFFFENKNERHVGEHLKKMTPNSDLQFINKKSGKSYVLISMVIIIGLPKTSNSISGK